LYAPAAENSLAVRSPHAIEALRFYNRAFTDEFENRIDAGLGPGNTGQLIGCVGGVTMGGNSLGAETTSRGTSEGKAGAQARERLSRRPRKAVVDSFGASTLNYEMTGRVYVNLFRMDSQAGAWKDALGNPAPANYTWSATDLQASYDAVVSALNWWAQTAYNRGLSLSFTLDVRDPFNRYTRTYVGTPTQYEPVYVTQNEAYRWMDDALKRVGYGSSPVTHFNVFTQNENFNQASVSGTGHDHGFTIYLVYNPGTAPTKWGGGSGPYSSMVPYLGGTATLVMWNTHNFGPNYLTFVVRHEMGHIFWACDEYSSSPGCSCNYCGWGVGPHANDPTMTNGNCGYVTDGSNASCASSSVECVMKNTVTTQLCTYTLKQIGWIPSP
jgi:hypothetical protein